MNKIIAVVSGKGGVGKTSTVINLGAAIQQLGHRVIIFDGDVSASTLGLHVNLYGVPVTSQDVLRGSLDILQAIYIHPTGLRIIPSSIALSQIKANMKKLRRVLTKLEGLVLVDSPPGLTKDVFNIMASSDEVFIVTLPDVPSVVDALKIAETARRMRKKIGGIVVNRVKNDAFELMPQQIEAFCGAKVISIIPEDSEMRKSIFERVPLVFYNQYSPAALAYQKLGSEILGVPFEEPKYQFLQKLRLNR